MNEIILGDCLEVMGSFEDACIDLAVTSPPYDDLREYGGYSFNFESIAKELYRVTKDGGVVVWIVADQTIKGNETGTSFRQALFFKGIGFNLYDTMIYEKAGTAPPHKNRYFHAFEYMFVFSKGKPKTVHILEDKKNRWAGTNTFGVTTRREKDGSLTKKGVKTVKEFGVRTNIWRYNGGRNNSTKDEIAFQHPAIFPEQLAKDHILSWSNEGDTVLDPFLGSGTTAKAAKNLNRQYIGIEINPDYVKIAQDRLKQEVLL